MPDASAQATERLTQAASRLGEAASAGPGHGATAPMRGEAGPGVVDAEFEEVDKRDRKAG